MSTTPRHHHSRRRPPSNILWLDLETTHLAPEQGVILEVAAMVTFPNFEPIRGASLHRVTRATAKDMANMTEHAHRMHSSPRPIASGLSLCDLALSSPHTLEEAETELLALLDRTCPGSTRVPLAGSTISTDLAWIRVHMPRLAARLHHQMIDVTSFLIVARNLFGAEAIDSIKPPFRATHCAMDDICSSFHLFVWLANTLIVPAVGLPPNAFLPRRIPVLRPLEFYIGAPHAETPHALF